MEVGRSAGASFVMEQGLQPRIFRVEIGQRCRRVSHYRDLAHRLLLEAAKAEDPAVAERLKKRAQEYLLLADAIEGPEPPLENEQASPVAQQQQQQHPQSQDDDDKE